MTDNAGSRSPGRGLHFGALPAGYPLGHYRFQSVLGVGGFGITYRAVDERLRRPVAIKEFLPTDFAIRVGGIEVRPRSPADQEMYNWGLRRFLDEARTLAALNDAPNIVHVYDYLEANGTGYMVMELIEGEPLDKVLARTGKIPAQSMLPLLPSMLKGLEAVHRAGYLHRDIKPGNVLVRTSGEPVLVDFGAARMSMGQRTQVMTSIYSPGYAPPEQYAFGTDANKQGPWSDIYAMAATLYHAITGTAPADSVRRLAKDNYIPLTQAAAGQYPPGFLAAIDAALSLTIERRPQSVAAWSQMLFGDSQAAPYGAGSQSRAAPPPPVDQGIFGAAPPPLPVMSQPGFGAPPSQGAPAWPHQTAGAPPPGQMYQAAPSMGGPGQPYTGPYAPQAYAQGYAPAQQPAPFGQTAPARKGGGAAIWIGIGAFVLVMMLIGAGAFYYLCMLNSYCGQTEEESSACYEELARVRIDIQRLQARLPGQTSPAPAPRATCAEQLVQARAELQRLQEMAANQPAPPVVEPKPSIPAPPPPPPDPRPPVVEPKPEPPVDQTPAPTPPVVEPKPPAPPVDTAPVVEPKPPAPVPPPPLVEPKPPVVEPKPAPTPVPPAPKPPVAEPKPPPVTPKPPPPPQPAEQPPSQRYQHEGRWFGSASLVRDGGRCTPTFTLNGAVRNNIFNGSSSLGGMSFRIRSETKRIADVSIPGMNVRSSSGTFESFNFETSTGCIYAVRMFRQ